MLINKRLPAPFTSDCVDYPKIGFQSSNDCIKACLVNSTLEHFKKLPFSVIVEEPLEFKHISNSDVTNRTFTRMLNKFESSCQTECRKDDCYEEYSITRIRLEPLPQKMMFTVEAPREPSYTITFHEKLGLTEYLIYVLSCFGKFIVICDK